MSVAATITQKSEGATAYQAHRSSEAMEARELTGSQILCEALMREGVELLYGYPGGAIMPFYDALTSYPALHHVLVRHEQAAAHAADGYARATGKVGVCVATSGPGATNLVTGLATAYMDSTPIVAITGQVARPFIGRDAFQETDILGVTQPITKHNFLVQRVEDLADIVHEAFKLARGGRPGPVVIDVPNYCPGRRIDQRDATTTDYVRPWCYPVKCLCGTTCLRGEDQYTCDYHASRPQRFS